MRLLILLLSIVTVSPYTFAEEDLKPARLDEQVIEKKKENAYFTGIPAIAFSPDSGFIYGIVLFHFNNGSRTDPQFEYSPYRQKTTLLAVQSTKGLNQIKLEYDAPSFQNSLYRLKIRTEYFKNISEQYFGYDERTLNDLKLPVALTENWESAKDGDFDQYVEELQKKRSDDTTWFRYNSYLHTETITTFDLERPLLSRDLIISAGLFGGHVSVSDYSGKDVVAIDDGEESEGEMQRTLLDLHSNEETFTGFGGGASNGVTLKIRYDTRDYEPDPRSGIVLGAETRIATQALGSTYSYTRNDLVNRLYATPLEALTLASQIKYSWVQGNAPFYGLTSLGGRKSLKGFRVNRYRGNASLNLNVEGRFRAWTVGGGGQSFVFTPISFLDAGRVYDKKFDISMSDLKTGGGIGLRIIWNLATVIGIEFATAGEDQSLYVNINHIF